MHLIGHSSVGSTNHVADLLFLPINLLRGLPSCSPVFRSFLLLSAPLLFSSVVPCAFLSSLLYFFCCSLRFPLFSSSFLLLFPALSSLLFFTSSVVLCAFLPSLLYFFCCSLRFPLFSSSLLLLFSALSSLLSFLLLLFSALSSLFLPCSPVQCISHLFASLCLFLYIHSHLLI